MCIRYAWNVEGLLSWLSFLGEGEGGRGKGGGTKGGAGIDRVVDGESLLYQR